MTQTEQDAIWIKNERKKLAKLIASISEIVSEQFMKFNDDKVKYHLTFEVNGIGFIEIRAYKIGNDSPIEKGEFWGLRYIFESVYFNKKSMQMSIDEASCKINELKAIAKKYAKLNTK